MNAVLVVDDEMIIRKGIMKIVEQYPRRTLAVYSASNGVEALEILAGKPVHMVVTDIRMPKMDGISLCEHINKQFPHIQTIVVSGYDDFSYAKQAMRYGVREYLLKPVHPPDLYSLFDKLISEWDLDTKLVSFSMYENWLEELEEVIWRLNIPRIKEMLEEGEEQTKNWSIRTDQLAQLLKDCLEGLKKRLLKRSFQAPINLPKEWEAMSSAALLSSFNQQVLEMADQLARMRGSKYRDPFEEAKAYIDTHLSEEVTLEEMAQLVGMSTTYFSHLFKKETNETFVQYRIRKRMEHAKALMDIPHYRIIDICQAVGYTDYPHFTKTFKKFTGYSPSEYRRLMGIE
ncbi:response regulator transcription factor [Paenibacillus silviterrae]|uniref:response regulator transcription factor n=1 Tax=Paenibacillus silviterrae TaxID=3242194 RepID=UPI002542C6E3|nr:response regulator [Paenibacillus chinjuensis]